MKFRDDIGNGSGPTNFIKKPKDGESIVGIIRGDFLFEGYVLWENRSKSEVPKGTPGAKFEFRINMIVKEGSGYVAKILEGGAQIYKGLRDLYKEWGDQLQETVIIIKRQGSDLDTEYSVMVAPPKQQVTKESLEYIETIELHQIGPQETEKKAPAAKQVKNFAPGSDNGGLPF